jgi:hypothetical protein
LIFIFVDVQVGHSRQAFRQRVNFAIARGNADAAIIQTLAVSKASRRRKTTPSMARELFTCDEVLRNVACAMRLAFPFTLKPRAPFMAWPRATRRRSEHSPNRSDIRRAGGAHL